MLDFGWSEFCLIALLAIVMLGPKDIPEIVYHLGRMVRRLQYLKFALSRRFDDFMEQMELHDLKKGGGLGDIAPRSLPRDAVTPPKLSHHAPAATSDPGDEVDEDEAYHASSGVPVSLPPTPVPAEEKPSIDEQSASASRHATRH